MKTLAIALKIETCSSGGKPRTQHELAASDCDRCRRRLGQGCGADGVAGIGAETAGFGEAAGIEEESFVVPEWLAWSFISSTETESGVSRCRIQRRLILWCCSI